MEGVGSARGVARDAAVQFRNDVSLTVTTFAGLHRPSIVRNDACKGEATVLWTIAVVLALLWLLGMVSNYTLGGFVHLLLVLAIASVLIRIVQGRRAI
jgi:hypothetical protein